MDAAIREWEPRLELCVPPPDARLFEPDATLYAVSLAPTHTVEYHRKATHVSLGDMIVVPAGLALDVEPEVRMLGVRYDGPPPDHFRERFIQVWGFDHFPAPQEVSLDEVGPGPQAVIAATDVRHRVIYDVWHVPSHLSAPMGTGLDVALLIGLEGEAEVDVTDGRGRVGVSPGMVVAIGPGLVYRVGGDGRLGRVTLLAELAHQARRREDLHKAPPPSPEYPARGTSGEGL
jgi:hypothetical protein